MIYFFRACNEYCSEKVTETDLKPTALRCQIMATRQCDPLSVEILASTSLGSIAITTNVLATIIYMVVVIFCFIIYEHIYSTYYCRSIFRTVSCKKIAEKYKTVELS